jgi:hypothetical protein
MGRWKYAREHRARSDDADDGGARLRGLLRNGATEAKLFAAQSVAASGSGGEASACLCVAAPEAVRVLSEVMMWCREAGRDPCVEFSTVIAGYYGDMRATRNLATPGAGCRSRVRVESVRVTDWGRVGRRGIGVGFLVGPAPPHLFPCREGALHGVEALRVATLRAGRGVSLEVAEALGRPASAAPAFRVALVVTGEPDHRAVRACARIVSS